MRGSRRNTTPKNLTFDQSLINGRILQQSPLPSVENRYGLKVGEHFVGPTGQLEFSRSAWKPKDQFSQGVLFHPREFKESEEAQREKAIASHEVRYGRGKGNPQADFASFMRNSRMPTELIESLRGVTSVQKTAPHGGTYSPSSLLHFGKDTGRIVLRRLGWEYGDKRPSIGETTLIHEMGHRADHRASLSELPKGGNYKPYLNRLSSGSYSKYGADPVAEGIADAAVDRYRSDEGKSLKGYRDEPWGSEYEAMYTAARAHFAATGENIREDGRNAYMHRMLNTSQHAQEALSKNERLLDVATSMSNAFKESRKVGRQLSLLDSSHEYDVYDLPSYEK